MRARLFALVATALGTVAVLGAAVVVVFAVEGGAFAGAPGLTIVRSYQRYAGEEGLAVGFGSVWTGSADSGDSVARTDIATGKSRSIPAPIDEDNGLFVGLGRLWQTDFGHGIVRRLDPRTNHVTARGGFDAPAGMAFADGRAFVALHHAQAVVEIDARTLKVLHTYRLPPPPEGAVASGPSELAVAAGSIWVDVPNLGATVRLALRGGKVEARLAGCGGNVAFGADAVWASCHGHLARIDPRNNTIRSTSAPSGITVALGDAVWVAGSSSITKVAASTGAIQSRQRFNGAFFTDLVPAQGRLWAFDANRVRVLELALPST